MKKLLGFLVAGGTATAINYLVFLTLLSLSANPLAAAAVGYISGIAVSFAINKFVVFRTAVQPSFLKYTFVYLAAPAVQLGLLALLIRLSVSPEIANAVAILVVVIANFFVMRKFVFKN